MVIILIFTKIQVKKIVNREFTHKVVKGKDGVFQKLNLKNQVSYEIQIKNDKYLTEKKKEITGLGFELKGNNWIINIK